MKRFVVLLVAVAVGVVVAALNVSSPAASINGAGISRQAVNNDLQAIGSNANYECYVRADLAVASGGQAQVQVGGVGGSGTYQTNFADYVLEQLIDQQLFAQVVQREGLVVTPADLVIGRGLLNQRINTVLSDYARSLGLSGAPCGGSAAAVLASLPSSFVNEQVQGQTDQSLLEAHAAGSSLSVASLGRYFAAHRAEFDMVCVSDIAVASQAEAASIRAAILAGNSSFAAEAQSNSIDSSTKANGGAAGCAPAVAFGLSQLVRLPVGGISQPIAQGGAYVLLTVTARSPSTFASITNLVRSVVLAAGQSSVQAQLTGFLRSSAITADPRYGQVVAGSASFLTPPPSPPTSSLVSPQANIPGGQTVSPA